MNKTGYFVQPPTLAREYPSHVQWSGDNRILSAPECDHVIALGNTTGFAKASIGSPTAQRVDENYRCADVCLLPYSPVTDWLYQRITARVQAANEPYYAFELSGLLEPVQLLRYEAPATADAVAGHYNLHQDFGAGEMGRRKLSVVIQLSEGSDYDGCELTLMTHFQETLKYRGRGEGVVFPSWTPHMVSNISRGTRYALAAWIHGHPFR